MEVLNKLRARLAEDSGSEDGGDRYQDPGAAGRLGEDGNISRQEALEREVRELKEHINKNYFVYVRRLEKRKERIKELEEYAKVLISDNETLEKKAKELKECQKQLSECRENLDQIEGFQNQELAKVKHMLLSAETAFENEKQKRIELREDSNKRISELSSEVEDLKVHLSSAEASHSQTEKEASDRHQAAIRKLEERLEVHELEGDEQAQAIKAQREGLETELEEGKKTIAELQASGAAREAKIASLESLLADTRERSNSLATERESLKNSLLELEISKHEGQATLVEERERARMELAKVTTEKETLEVTLERRDKELKAKKEDFRTELEALKKSKEEMNMELQTKFIHVAALEAEISALKSRLSEESNRTTQALNESEKLKESQEELEKELRRKEEELSRLHLQLVEEKGAKEALVNKNLQLEETLADSKASAEQFKAYLERQTSACESLEGEKLHLSSQCDLLSGEVGALKKVIAHKEATFMDRLEQTEVVRDLRKALQSAEDELADKRKMVRLHQQRVNDIKKTFQQELKSNILGFDDGSSSPVPTSHSTSPPLPEPLAITEHSDHVVTMTEVNFKYLKHVIFKFFTSPEYEAKHLTRAISALLRLTPDEEKLLSQHLEWKMSWFGSKPKLGSGQFSLSIEPS